MAIEREEGGLNDHLPATPPDWLALPSQRFRCRVAVMRCFGYNAGSMGYLRQHLLNKGHRAQGNYSQSSILFTNLLTF